MSPPCLRRNTDPLYALANFFNASFQGIAPQTEIPEIFAVEIAVLPFLILFGDHPAFVSST